MAAAGVVAGAAYFLAGDPRPVAAGVSAESFQQQAAAFGLQSSDGVFPPGGAASPALFPPTTFFRVPPNPVRGVPVPGVPRRWGRQAC